MGYYRRLPLEGLDNARDLGGYPCPDGVTRYGVFIRSELPSSLTAADLDYLKQLGLTTVLDFRGTPEIRTAPDVLSREDFVRYHHMPAFDEEVSRGADMGEKRPAPPDMDRASFQWGSHYAGMAEEHKAWVKSVLELLAEAPGAALFHCTTGKDRTGIITALLLGLCGVAREDIIADYCVSQVYLKTMYSTMRHLLPGGDEMELSDPFFSTAPENMETLLDHIDGKYGGIEPYLRNGCGVEEATLAALRAKLLERRCA